MNTLQNIQQQIDSLQSQIAEVKKEINNFDASDYISESEYDDMLDECYDMVHIGNLSYYPSQVLREVDPVAYRCGYNDYIDSVELEEIPEYQELQEQLEELENELEELENNND